MQNAVKFSLSSAILRAAEIGWHTKPTKRSVAAKQPRRMKEGERRSSLFAIANTIRKFPAHVSTENKKSKEQVSILAMKTSSESARVRLMYFSSKKKQVFSDLFMVSDEPSFVHSIPQPRQVFLEVNLFFSTESAFLKSLLSTKASVSGLAIQLSSVCSRVKVNVNSPIYSTEQSVNVRNNIQDTNCLIPSRSN